jgi:pilus assembly protein CpaC
MEAQQAYDLAARLAGDGNKVVNGIARGRDQVMLKVTVAEIQRDIIKQLGIDISGTLSYGQAVLNFNNSNPIPVYGQALVTSNAFTGSIRGVTASLRAMERAGVIRTLAEPNLTAISGESANFLAGGEFPVPSGYTCTPPSGSVVGQIGNCQYQIQWKKFGVGLNFTPVAV